MSRNSNGATQDAMPKLSRRILQTDTPVMIKVAELLGGAKGTLSLGQGVVWWNPPEEVLKKAAQCAPAPQVNMYGADAGTAELRAALRSKVESENGLKQHNVMVTAGANQAYSNLVLALVDAADPVVVFKPYYFNCLMALQMHGDGGGNILVGPNTPDTMRPDLDWLERQLQGPRPPRLVVLCNPCNPSGVTMTREELQRAADMTGRAGAWLLVDETYEHFIWGEVPYSCVSGPNVVHIFSFSKAYGMMGWRVGYIAYPDFDGSDTLGRQMLKVQDTIPICAALLSQQVALGALALGRDWVLRQVASLEPNRAALLDGMSPLGTLGNGVWGDGAIYLWGRLPKGCEDDEAVVRWMVHKHGIVVVPGSGSGMPGHIRAAFGKPAPAEYPEAAQRLKTALTQLAAEGMAAVR